MQIDVLELKIGKVIYKDYSRGSRRPYRREFVLNINERYKNIQDPYSLVSLIVVKSLLKTDIVKLASFDIHVLKGGIADILLTGDEITTEAVVKAQDAIKETREIAEEKVRRAEEKAKEIRQKLKNF